MASGGADVIEALGAAAGERLRAGAAPGAVCGELAARTRWWWDAALGVGRALGIPEPELLDRLRRDPGEVQDELGPGEEELYGELMEELGVFDVAARLDERELLIAERLRAAVRAMGGVASGHAQALSRRLVTGEPAWVFHSLARSGPRSSCGRPAEFWEALVEAGELLAAGGGDECEGECGHGDLAQALGECRARLADCARPDRSGLGRA
ncbi:hypothetical protein [Streptomyces filamentosus]|uniref:hypothetical protein n=1 Tax=Streptomyces filamentosus TaxID=67294 RepID=UPI0012392B2C|nr:hypothetical protein [Streptomyces filamentosus]